MKVHVVLRKGGIPTPGGVILIFQLIIELSLTEASFVIVN